MLIKLHHVQEFYSAATALSSEEGLKDLLMEMTPRMGFRHFALVHHIDLNAGRGNRIHIVDYPPNWAECFESRRLFGRDPIHRASHRTNIGFVWSNVGDLIDLTSADRAILNDAYQAGLGDGFTIPAHLPGELNGSCSFAMSRGDDIDRDQLPYVQLVGAFAFEAARRMRSVGAPKIETPRLTDRQAECVALVARGKTDWEISRMLGIGQETVTQHLKDARDRYGITTRTLLAIRVLFDGLISFTDIFGK